MSDHQPIKPIKQEVRGGVRGGGRRREVRADASWGKKNKPQHRYSVGRNRFESACAEREMGGNARQRQADTQGFYGEQGGAALCIAEVTGLAAAADSSAAAYGNLRSVWGIPLQ